MLRVIAQPLIAIASNATHSPSAHGSVRPRRIPIPVLRNIFLLFVLFIVFVFMLNGHLPVERASLPVPRRLLATLISRRESFLEKPIQHGKGAAPLAGIPESVESPVDAAGTQATT